MALGTQKRMSQERKAYLDDLAHPNVIHLQEFLLKYRLLEAELDEAVYGGETDDAGAVW